MKYDIKLSTPSVLQLQPTENLFFCAPLCQVLHCAPRDVLIAVTTLPIYLSHVLAPKQHLHQATEYERPAVSFVTVAVRRPDCYCSGLGTLVTDVYNDWSVVLKSGTNMRPSNYMLLIP